MRRASIVLAWISGFSLIVLLRVPFCPMASVLGIPCPGCGLTRATLALAQGQVRLAFALHPLVFVLSPLFGLAVASAAFHYVRGPSPRSTTRPASWLTTPTANALAGVLLIATLAVWGARFLGYLGGPAPVQTFGQWARAGGTLRR